MNEKLLSVMIVDLLYLRIFTQGREGDSAWQCLLMTSSQIPLAVSVGLQSSLGIPFTPKKVTSDVILPLRIYFVELYP